MDWPNSEDVERRIKRESDFEAALSLVSVVGVVLLLIWVAGGC